MSALATVDELFKYGRLNEHSEELFSTPCVWFSPPSQLNDPFECRPWFTFDGNRADAAEVMARVLRRQNPDLTPENAMAHAVSLVLQGRHENPRMWEALRNHVVSMLGKEIGLYCLSERKDSILMWSHYSDNHKGYCLCFEATDHTPVFGAAQQVGYSNSYPTVHFFETAAEDQVLQIFLTKYEEWAYEREWRIVDHEAGPGAHEYPAELLTGVVFGMRMPDSDRARVREWIARRGTPTRLYEAIRSDDAFHVEIRETT